MGSVPILRTDHGDFRMPPQMAALYRASRIRRDGQPDQRCNTGKQFNQAFAAFKDTQAAIFMAGA